MKVEVLLYVHRNRRLFRDGSPGRPPRLYTAPELWSMGVSKQINMVTIRLLKDGEKGAEGNYIPVTTRMTPALRWAAMRAILMFR